MAELRIMITVPLPDDMFERAALLTGLKVPVKECSEMLATMADGVVTKYEPSDAKIPKPRKQRADAGKARKTPPVIREAAE